jgi:cell wall-associated NlpC family hydrolase
MADFFKQYGPGNENAAIQNYAGPAYQSKASGGVPSGLDLPTELTDYYKQQVIAVLTSGSGAGAGGQMGAATNAAFSVGTAVNAQVSKTDVEAQIEATTRQHLGDPKVLVDGVMKPAYGWCDAFVNNMIQQATGVNKRFANADQQIRAAIAGQPGAGTVIDQSQAKPGDLVGWKGDQREAGDPAGHIGIYSGGNKYIGTTSAGVQEKTLPANAIFIRPDGVVSNGPTPGSVLHVGNGTASGAPGTIDASQTPSQPQMPFVVQPTAAQMASQSAYGSQMSGMDARGQGEVDALLTKITPLFTNIAADRGINIGGVTQTFGANRTRDPNATEKQMIDNAGLADSYNVASKVGVAIEAINKGLAITPQMYKDIADAAGPVGGLIDAQVAATADLEQHTRTLANLKSVQAADDASHQLLTQQRQNDATDLSNQHTLKGYDEQKQQRDITAARLVTTRQEQDADTSRQRTQTLDQRAIDDKMTAQQRAWQDEQTRLADSARVAAESQRQQDMADQNHKQNLDDAYQIVQRQEQDQQRILNFRGGQDMITLQDAKKTLDDQHRIATEGMQQNEGLYVSLGKGSSTEAQATAYASQAAAIDDARKKADDLYAKQSEANTRAQDALTKYNAQVMFNLQTEQIAADRKHQDDLKNIDEAALKRHNDYNTQLYDLQVEAAVRAADHLVITRQEEDVAKARTRGIEDEQFAIAATRLAEQRRWQDDDVARQTSITLEQQGWAIDKMHADELARQQDQAYADRKTQNTNDQQAEQTSITNIGKVITGLDAAIARVNTIIQQYGVVAAQQSGLLNAPVNNAPGANGSQYTRNLGGFATGTAFSPGGDAQVNEQGGEMRTLLSGETIIPADQTKRMFDSLLSVRNNVSPISSAPSYHEGNITIQMGDSSLSLSAGAQAKIRAIVQDEIESQQPTTYTARQAATGGLKR